MMELEGARKVFGQLGAKPDIDRLDVLVSRPYGRAPGGLTRREVEVLRLIASGKTNRAIAKELGEDGRPARPQLPHQDRSAVPGRGHRVRI